MSESSFVKKKKKIVEIPGTKLSVHNCQLLTSSGISSFDNQIGGGIPVGAVVVIEEDEHRRYSDVMLRSFVTEGLFCGQYVHIVSPNGSKILQHLPAVQECSPASSVAHSDDEQMRIAWRYQEQKNVQKMTNTSSHVFNYSKKMNPDDIPKNLISMQDACYGLGSVELGRDLLSGIHDQIVTREATSGSKVKSNLLRIAVSPEGTSLFKDSRFLITLKSLVRCSFSLAMVLVPNHTSENIKMEMADIADFVIKLTANQDSAGQVNPLYKDFDGLWCFKKVAAINTLMKPPHVKQLGFKLLKTRFKMEKLHLPPDLSETVSRTSSKPACNLDF